MGLAIKHRGPDDSGEWSDEQAGIALGQRRLSIVDLSSAGHQPMDSADQRYVFVFNGEIYNHRFLRAQLEAEGRNPAWRGHSDTEILLAGFVAWGVKETLQRAIGMFAFALWDRRTRHLTLGRDRLGEKPLYYGWQGDTFLFGSELKALRAHPSFVGGVDRDVLTLYLRHNCVPAPYSIHPGIFKLQPATLMTLSIENPEPVIEYYWSAIDVALAGHRDPFRGSATEAVDALDNLLRDAIGQQMVADVPLGAFLSGGVDSTVVVALMQAQSASPVKTFTIGFHETAYNEARYAKAVANQIGTDHTELYVAPHEARDVIPSLARFYDEPFADSSQIPTMLVSQLARQHVTVSLSGDAGDELFCGYNRYLLAQRLSKGVNCTPFAVRKALYQLTTSISTNAWDSIVSAFPRSMRPAYAGDKMHKLGEVVLSRTPDDIYRRLVSHWHEPGRIVLNAREPETLLTTALPLLDGLSYVERMMLFDLITYLPDDNLTKVDRASMSVSLESRVPFLDHRVVEFAWRLPMDYKYRDGQSKWALRQVLDRYVQRDLIERPKMGFSVPIGKWLRNDLRDWADSLLDESRLSAEGYFNPKAVRRIWNEHVSGRRNWQYQLWDLLMFQSWLDTQASA